jgi:tetratricopeptide (TPR) repeat protein
VGEALAGRPGNRRRSGPAAAGIAAHFHLAGKEDLAGEYYRLAGDHARSVFANRDALRNYQTALSLGWQPAADLLEAAGDLLTLEGDYAKATHNYQKAIETQPAPATIAQLLVKIGEIHHRLGSWDAAEDHFQAAAQAAGENPPAAEKAHLLTVWARTANQRGDPRRARELAGAALGLAQGNPRVQILVHNVLGMIARRQEDLPLALEHLETSLGLARASGDLLACTAALNNLALLHSDTGDVPQAIVLEEEALGICVQIGDRHREAAVLNNLADLYHRSAQAEPAMQRLKQAVAIFAEIGGQGNEMQPGVWGMTEW